MQFLAIFQALFYLFEILLTLHLIKMWMMTPLWMISWMMSSTWPLHTHVIALTVKEICWKVKNHLKTMPTGEIHQQSYQ